MTAPDQSTPTAPPPVQQRTRRALPLRRVAATVLIVTGAILLVLCARAIDLGIAPPQGPSRAQVWLGAGGVLLTVTGIALVVQPFAPTPTDHPADGHQAAD